MRIIGQYASCSYAVERLSLKAARLPAIISVRNYRTYLNSIGALKKMQ